MTATSHLFRFMLTSQVNKNAVGHIEVECPECGGTGFVEYERIDKPWTTLTRDCDVCNGHGTIWIECGNDD